MIGLLYSACFVDGQLPTEMMNRIQLMSGTGSASNTDPGAASTITNARGSESNPPRGGGGSERPSSSRMGSARFHVLPPIQSPVPEKPAGVAG